MLLVSFQWHRTAELHFLTLPYPQSKRLLSNGFQGGRLMVRYHVPNRPIVLGRGMV